MNTLYVFCAKYLIVIVPLLVALVFWKVAREERRIFILRGIIVLIFSVALAKGGGALFNDPRPFVVYHITPLIPHAPDNGFPSDHALLAFACAFLILAFNKRLAALGYCVALVIGLSRVACGLHSMLDIGGSLLIAAVAAGFAALFVRRTAGTSTPAEVKMR